MPLHPLAFTSNAILPLLPAQAPVHLTMPARAVVEHAGPQATAGHPAHKKRHARRPPKASDIPAPTLPLPAAKSRRIGADLNRRPACPREFCLLVLLHDDLYYIPECMRQATSLAVMQSCLNHRK
ncbi:MAG: hypothetical protein MO853_03455 [Candidatus Protistobacter heckmanni]|nr:hypothetical protein [Candidatus Protistobacter heckmanni]